MSLIKLFLGGNNLVFSRLERVWSVTSRLGTGKWLTLFYSVAKKRSVEGYKNCFLFTKFIEGSRAIRDAYDVPFPHITEDLNKKSLSKCCGSGSGIRIRFLFDPWTRIPNPYF
jgi:hypothetical protein